ncbi:hypothetical protein N8844_03865 [Planktomarina temperata]|nr:hypothetical protein [Planktomarina temperata]
MFNTDVIAYDEKKLVKLKWYFPIFLPLIIVLSSIGILNYYRTVNYFRNYNHLNAYIRNKLHQRASNHYHKVLWIKAAGIDGDVIVADGVRKQDRYLYLYDPIVRYPNLVSRFIFFENVYTFDWSDSNLLNIRCLPMFTAKQPPMTNSSTFPAENDLVYVGSFTPQRFLSCIVLIMFSKGIKYRLILVNKFLLDFNFFGVELKNKNLTRDSLMKLYNKSKIVLELRDLDQAGPSQRKNDSLNIGLQYLSIPSINLRGIKKYYNLNLSIQMILNRKNKKNLFKVPQYENESQLNADNFLMKVLNLETSSDR